MFSLAIAFALPILRSAIIAQITPVKSYNGNWVTTTRYSKGSVVTYGNQIFLAPAASRGKPPVNSPLKY